MFPSLVVKLFLLLVFSPVIHSFFIDFSSGFPDESRNQLILRKSNIQKNAIQVTPDVTGAPITYEYGWALYRKQFRLRSQTKGTATFNTTFVLNISNRTSPGGEGLAFILSGANKVPQNSSGKWLGIVNGTSNGTSQASIVAVEFDTRKSHPRDIDDNHVGLDVNGCNSIKQVSLNSYGINLSGGTDVKVNVRYDGQNMTVSVSVSNGTEESMTNLILSEPLNVSEYLPETVFVGFSASTSNYTQLNCVKSWVFHGSSVDEDHPETLVLVIVSVVALVIISAVVFYVSSVRNSREEDNQEGTYQIPNIESHIRNSTAPRKFGLRELKKATGKFSSRNMLGEGGFGTVYKGTWRGKDVAVKKVSKRSGTGKQEFIAEVTTIGNLNHKNLVKLIGWCYESRKYLLVYEYMPNGSLDKFIFGNDDDENTLSWEKRLSIIHGVAQALEYLHNGSEKRVLHRDIKASNIMLDSDFSAKLGDFGLARTIQEREKTHHSTVEIAGTPGYMAPESLLISRATVETDVYSFGVLIMEVVSGRKPGNQNEQDNYDNRIVNWLWELYRDGRILDAADSRLRENFTEEEMKRLLVLGLACCNPNPHNRPAMETVLQVLTGQIYPPDVPLQRPAFVWPPLPQSVSGLERSLAEDHVSDLTWG